VGGRLLDRSCRISCFAIAAVLVLVSRSRMTSTGKTMSAWAVVLVGALWTLTTAVTEVTVIADLPRSRDLAQFEAWWSFAEGHGNGFSTLAVAVASLAGTSAGIHTGSFRSGRRG
jgi:hypothetical protein